MMLAALFSTVAAASPLVLAVGVNAPAEKGLAPLSFADDDAAAAARLFGGARDRTWLLTVPDEETQENDPGVAERARLPTLEGLRAAVEEVASAARADRARGDDPVVMVWMVGHGVVGAGGEGALALSDGLLTAAMLRRDVLGPLSRAAHRVHLVVDACHAGAFVRSRAAFSAEDAAEVQRDFAELERTPFANVGVLLASGQDQKTYEWDRVHGGVFSALVRSGLRGLADADLDGRVTYPEIGAFVVSAVEAIPNPAARPHMDARPPSVETQAALARTAWFGSAPVMHVDASAWGRFSVEDLHGRLVAAGHLEPGFSPVLHVVESEALVVRTAQMGQMLWRHNALTAGNDVGVKDRGPVEEALREGMFRTPFGPSYQRGYAAAMRVTTRNGPAPVETRAASAWPMRLLVGGAVLAAGAVVVPLIVGGAGALLAAEGAYAFVSTDVERVAWAGAARGGVGAGVVLASAAAVAGLVVGAGVMLVMALR